ncbi:MAG: hypothetical protein RLZZ450_3845 [Pseudomonadota bacterium]|jgi:hypothetical protein
MRSQGVPNSKAERAGGWSQERRLEFIDFRLRWDGQLNRADLTDFFGISVPQASLDIAKYLELAPGNLSYDRSARVYIAAVRFRAIYPSSGPTQFMNELLTSARDDAQRGRLAFGPPVAVVPTPTRSLSLPVLVALQRAIRERSGLKVVYQSLSQPEAAARVLSPHAFAHDGFRWHVRAYCHTRESFRDFVVARFLEVHGPSPAGPPADQDEQWNTEVKLVLVPHPKLSKAHRRAIELDYGMTDGRSELRCRAALVFYVLRHLRLDDETSRAPEAQQVVLKNRAEVARTLTSGDPLLSQSVRAGGAASRG